MKVCKKCEVVKPLTEFYVNCRKCKKCVTNAVKINRELNKDYYLEYDRNRLNTRERNSANIERSKEKYTSDPEYKAKIIETKKKWVDKNPLKRKAQIAANNAVRDGKIEIKVNCEHCSVGDTRLQKHHESYLEENWLKVTWLCTKCHGDEHKRLNELGRDPDKLT